MSAQHTPGRLEPFILDIPLADIPTYVEQCIKASGGSLTRFAAPVRAAALEEAAGVCDDKHDEWRFGDGEDAASGPKDCAAAIRQLKDKP